MSTKRKTEREGIYNDMLVLHIPDAMQHTSANGIAKILRRRLAVDVAEVRCPVYPGTTRCSTGVASRHSSDVSPREPARCGRSIAKGRLWGDEGLGLLRLGDVCATVFIIVDLFTGPVVFGWEGVDDLSKS